MNLMSNAIKYTPDGGNIIFSIEEKPNGFSELGCYEFTIEDNGIGMSPEFQKIIFQLMPCITALNGFPARENPFTHNTDFL